jgi:DNA-3-methyladenine glycosylase II
MALIDTEADLAFGLAELVKLDPVMAELVAMGVRPPLRRREPGFTGLAAIVVGQQVSVASARAIWGRLTARVPELSPAAFMATPDEALKGAGLSAPKLRTLRAAATAALEGSLDFDALASLPADEAHARLTPVKGVGPWTADIYLLFCLGHADAFPSGDLALQEAVRLADGLDVRPDAKALLARAEIWRPWRGVAAKLLWAYYAVAKSREGVVIGADPANPSP